MRENQFNKKKIINSSILTLSSYFISQLVRLITNLFLTRLLFPELFGLMGIINVFIQGLVMFSDMGIGQSIIQNERGENRDFLNTAWTIQAIRGTTLWLIACIISYPLSKIYDQRAILYLLPIVAFNSVILGFISTSFHVHNRKINLLYISIIEISAQVLSSLSMILIALKYPSIWALASGSIISAATRVIGSYFLSGRIKHRFHLEKEAMNEIIRFGRWIFISSACAFIVGQGDRLILGKILSMEQFGVYSIALFLSRSIDQAMDTISQKILFPIYSRFAEEPQGNFRQRMVSIKKTILFVGVICISFVIMGGDYIVTFLYDERYQNAGWMLQILSIGSLISIISKTISPAFIAMGDSFRFMSILVIKMFLFLSCMLIGYYLYNFQGLIMGIVASQYLTYFVILFFASKYKINTIKLDLSVLILGLSLSFFGWYFLHNVIELNMQIGLR